MQMANRIPDAIGIELLAIIAIVVCLTIIVRLSIRERRGGRCHFCGCEMEGDGVGECEDCVTITAL